MNLTPGVSICIPTYNQAQFLAQALESALNQTLKDIEVVVSVNHCTDHTEDVLKNYRDKRLRIVRPKQFLPMSENWHFCITQSRGRYVNLLSSDDLLLPKFAMEQAALLDQYPDAAFVHCACDLINEHGKVIGKEKSIHPSFVRKGEVELRRYIYGPRCVLVGVLIRRTAYDQVGGFRSWKIVGDWDLHLRLLQVGDVIYNQNVLAQRRLWLDAEGKRARRLLDQVQETVALYREYEPLFLREHPEWKHHFARAKRRQAQSSVYGLASISDSTLRQQIERAICELSSSWRVRLILASLDIGLGSVWLAWKRFKLDLRQRVKAVLYPKDQVSEE